MPGGNTRADRRSTLRTALHSWPLVVAVGVGDDAADVAAGGPDDEHAEIRQRRGQPTIAFLTRGA